MPLGIEHPMITEINQYGYPKDMYEEKHCGIDYFGNEIIEGDEIFEMEGETVLLDDPDNLKQFLTEFAGAKFTLAK